MDVDSILRTLRAYDASFDAAAVRAALSDPNSADAVHLRRWAQDHLAPDTLLTVDELNQYAALEDSGLAERFAVSDLTANYLTLNDQVMKDAIDEMNRSTLAISRHTEALQQKQDVLDRLVGANRDSQEERAALEASQARRWQGRRDDLTSDADELLHSLNTRILELEQQSRGTAATIRQIVDTLLRSDDKLLSSLQKLGLELETEDAEEQQDITVLRETCARLIKYTVEAIRTKLDRIYLESLESAVPSTETSRVAPEQVAALQGELESLYAEILPVAQMSAEQQFLEPALKTLADKNGQRMTKSAQATGYIHDCLDYATDRAQDLTARIEASHSYQLALTAVLETSKTALESLVSAAAEASPTRQKSTSQQGTLSPARTLQKQLSHTPAVRNEPPLEEILRTLAISVSHDDVSSGTQPRIDELAATLASRRAKASDVARNVQEMFENAATKHVADGKLAIQMVRDSILAETPFGDVRLLDPEIEGSIAVLARELAGVDEKLKRLSADITSHRGKSAKKDELITRWGS